MATKINILDGIPSEIVHSILEYLNRKELRSFAASSTRAYEFGCQHLWKDVVLTDRYTRRTLIDNEERELREHQSGNGMNNLRRT